MTTVLFLLRAHLRRRRRTMLIAALSVGLAGGVVLSLAAGAHRTGTAYARLIDQQNAADIIVTNIGGGTDQRPQLDQAARLPQVVAHGLAADMVASVTTPAGRVFNFADLRPIVLEDERVGDSIDTFRYIDGRSFDRNRSDEAVIAFSVADRYGLRVGDKLLIRPLSPAEVDAARHLGRPSDLATFGSGPTVTVTIVGEEAGPAPADFPPYQRSNPPNIYLTPAFDREYAANAFLGQGLLVRLRNGDADVDAFKSAVEQIGNGDAGFITLRSQQAATERSTQLEAASLAVLAVLVGLALLLVYAQGVARRTFVDSAEYPILRAIGAVPGQLVAVHLLRALIVGTGAAVVAVGVAVLLSPLTPIGTARVADPSPGIRADWTVLGPGAFCVLAVVLLVSLVPAIRMARIAPGLQGTAELSPRSRPSRLAAALTRLGLPPSAVTGIRFAVEPGRGRSAVPVRTAVAGCTVAIATVAAALTFNSALSHLLDTPHNYGWNWDLNVDAVINDLSDPPPADRLAAIPGVGDVATLGYTEAAVDGQRYTALLSQPVKGVVPPTVTEGRAPVTDDEVLLGAGTLPGVDVGQTVSVAIGARSTTLRVVGRGVLPNAGEADLGTGVWATPGALRSLDPGVGAFEYLVRFQPGADPAAVTGRIEKAFGPGAATAAQKPEDLSGFDGLDSLPVLIGSLLALAGGATLLHTLATSARRRRRDLAVLKTMGFVRRQVLATLLWQALTLAALATVIGVPLGVAAGRWGWTVFIDHLGATGDAAVPAGLLLVIPAVAVIAAAAAIGPGRVAARTPPAVVLRTE